MFFICNFVDLLNAPVTIILKRKCPAVSGDFR